MSEAARSILAAVWAVRWPVVALLVMLACNWLFTPLFFTLEVRDGRVFGVLVDIVNHGSKIGIVALGMTLVIATGGVDLSVGAVVAIAGALAATLVTRGGLPWQAAAACALGVGVLCGAWNGLLVVGLRLQPIVATLILMVAGRGVAQLITDGSIITFNNQGLAAVGNAAFLGLPIPVWLLLAVAVVTVLATRRTALGLFIESVGDNQAAARLAGVPDRLIRMVAYSFCGLCAGVAGLIDCSYIRAADANNAGQLLELDAILAVVIGGTALTGGRFLLVGSIVGAMLMQTLTTTLYMQDVSADISPAPKAIAVVLVCLLQSPRVRRWFGARRGRGSA